MEQSPHTVPGDRVPQPDVAAIPGPSRAAGELFLESLQRRVYAAVGLTAEDCQQREWVGQQTILPLRLKQKADQLSPSEFAHYRSAVLEALTRDELLPRPTAFERPHQYSILRGLKSAIEAAAAQLAIPLPFAPVLGTLPTRLLEPLMIRVPGSDEVVVVIDGSLLTYVHLLAKAAAHALPMDLLDAESLVAAPSAPGWEEAIDPHGVATQRFSELMLAAITGSAASAPSYAPDPACEQLVASLCECMELFLVGREYARLCEGDHLVAGTERRQAFGQSFEALVWTRRQELQADALGLGLTLAAAGSKGECPAVAFWAVDILLASLGVLDRSMTALENPLVTSLAASPTFFEERRGRLRDLIRELQGDGGAGSLASALDPLMATLAERFEIVLHDAQHGPHVKH